MSPSYFFLLMLALTVAGLLAQWTRHRGQRLAIQELARKWNMHYAADDRFRLADRVAEMLPIPGAAHVQLSDLIYGNEGDGYRYIFCAWFTEGVVHSKRRCVRVATFHESSRTSRDGASAGPLIVAPEGGSVLEQFRKLHDQLEMKIAMAQAAK